MNVIGAERYRLAPVVVDDQLAAVAPANIETASNLAPDLGGGRVLEP